MIVVVSFFLFACFTILMDAKAVEQSTVFAPIYFNGNQLDFDEILDIAKVDSNFEYDKNLHAIIKFKYAKNIKLVGRLRLDFNIKISKYTPFVSFDVPIGEIGRLKGLSLSEFVEKIYLSNNIAYTQLDKIDTNMNTRSVVGLDDVISNYIFSDNTNGFDGSGVAIGILEPGLMDASHDNFIGRTVIINHRQGVVEDWEIDPHTTLVASIVTIIAPGARILSAAIDTYATNVISETEWLIDNGANIINHSWGEMFPSGIYSGISSYFDFVSDIMRITMIAASGNSNVIEDPTSGYVANPALGGNVIAVGSVDSDIMMSSFSSYKEITDVDKPNIMGVGDSLLVPGFPDKPGFNPIFGTSFSAPQVTGAVAILMEQNVELKSNPQMVMALLTATASTIQDGVRDESGLFDKYGAGLLNVSVAMENNIPYRYQIDLENSQYLPVVDFYAMSYSTIKVSFANLVGMDTSIYPEFSVFNIRIEDWDGNVIDIDDLPGADGFFSQSRTRSNNVVMINTLFLDTGWYRLRVLLTSIGTNDIQSVAISIVQN